jgi:transcriptional regulator with XRE-family HTH domain
LSANALAERSGVSRAMIAKIERAEAQPTAALLGRLSAALGMTLSELVARAEDTGRRLARRADQPLWTDPASGYVRRNLSPAARSPIQLVDVIFPAGRRVAYDAAVREVETHQQVWMIDGVMELDVGGSQWRLEAGDCLAMQLDKPIAYRNPGRKPARYLVALASVSHPASTRNR